MNILFIGDIVGKIGRAAVTKLLPEVQKEFAIDFVIANAENLAHGKGVTSRTLQEMQDAGVDCFTSGNHIWRNKEVFEIFTNKSFPLLRPANYAGDIAGCGYQKFNISQKNVFVLNLQGRVFLQDLTDNPFLAFENLYQEIKDQADVIIVDFHAEATSEKQAFGYYADGKAHAIVGTHTHIQTADERMLKQGSLYISDVGFVGGGDTVLGVAQEGIINTFVTGLPERHEIPEDGEAVFNAVVLTFAEDGTPKNISRIKKTTTI